MWFQRHIFRRRFSAKDQRFREKIEEIIKQKPRELNWYRQAFIHSSATREHNGKKINNERLEFLGDAVIGMVITEILFKKYPNSGEGFLTTMRSKMVSRKSLNQVAERLGIPAMIEHRQSGKTKAKSINGDALEALVGAIFMDRGYRAACQFIERLLKEDIYNLKKLREQVVSHKSVLLEWAAKNRQNLSFKLTNASGESHQMLYEVSVMCNGKAMSSGCGSSKKKAEEAAARNFYNSLDLSDDKKIAQP